jgi:hypothetical protein
MRREDFFVDQGVHFLLVCSAVEQGAPAIEVLSR